MHDEGLCTQTYIIEKGCAQELNHTVPETIHVTRAGTAAQRRETVCEGVCQKLRPSLQQSEPCESKSLDYRRGEWLEVGTHHDTIFVQSVHGTGVRSMTNIALILQRFVS